ncbi:death domain-containing membrane protein NRADD-like [Pollicipes pollicipes]|uniref:death domain-containing membrane protein NRADD-like n=1 Tax=Pollicipes pollicipes TaxID=41117 RepID=UPI0018857DFB|nr:death domain-containing membrane protein NRADD-like [Pollicipes pollicipes]
MDESFHRLSEGGGGGSGVTHLSTGAAGSPWPADHVSSDIPIYCGILGTVIFVLLLYVAVRHWKLRTAPQKSSAPAAPSAVVVTRPASRAEPAACPQVEPLFPAPLRKRLAEMPATERCEIETQLCCHPTNNWSALAAALGYSKQQVRQIQELAAERKTNPARMLIADWSKRNDATVTSFVQALTAIGRRDLVGLVLLKPVRLTVANVDNFV